MRTRTLLLAPAAAAVLACAGCLASSVVAPEDRAAFLGPADLPWAPLDPAADRIDGLYASVAIEGEASLAVLKLFYHFAGDGAFTGAALLATDPPRFEVLSGRWSLELDELWGLRLGADAPPARVEVAPDHLRLTGDEGTVVLRNERIY